MANGFNVIADDFTPILREDFKTYCFPSAISIKEKSYSFNGADLSRSQKF